MPITFRCLVVLVMLGLAAAGCTRYGVSGPDDLGLVAQFDPQLNPQAMSIELSANDPDRRISRNQVLSRWIIRSDYLCSDYLLRLSRSIRDTRLGTDIVATVLTGLATIFAQPAVTRPLSGSATIALGVGGDIQSDLFLQQAGDVVSTAIQAVRTRARTELQKKFSADYAEYTVEQGLVDVQRYDRETCNLNVGLNEIRASLNIIGPAAPSANNPIIPLSAPGGEPSGGPAARGGAAGATAPVATTIIPPTVQNTPQGGIVVTPGKVVNTPIAPGAPTTAPPSSPPGPGPTSRPGAGSGSTFRSGSGLGSPSRSALASGGGALSARTPLPLPIPIHPDDIPPNAQSAAEKNLSRDFLKAIQSALCVEPTGDFDSETRSAIQSWRSIKQPTPVAGPLAPKEVSDLLGLPPCERTVYKSPFEQAEYPSPVRVKALQSALARVLGRSPPDPLSGKLDDETRAAIRDFQKLNGLSQTGIMTATVEDALRRRLRQLPRTPPPG